MNSRNQAPGPTGLPILGNARDFTKDALGFLDGCQKQFGDLFHLKLSGVKGYVALHPSLIQQVLSQNQQNYSKSTRGILKYREVLGTGLFTSEGDHWRRQRRIVQPTLKKAPVDSFSRIMLEEAKSLSEHWEENYLDLPSFDLYSDMMRITLKIVSLALLGKDVSDATSSVGQALDYIFRISHARILRPIDLPLWVPTPEHKRLRNAIRELDVVVHRIISNQRTQDVDDNNLISRLIHARDPETGESMTDSQVRDEVLIMFLAGHETTANTLAWLWYSLSQSPESDQRLQEEIQSVVKGEFVQLEEICQLKYTEALIQETMRLYPPGWWFARRAVGSDNLDGYHLPKDHHVWMCAFLTHRHPEFWQRPNEFEPERFLKKGINDTHRFAYFPFGGGARYCIGSHFAMLEMKIIVATLVKRFRFSLPPDFSVVLSPRSTLRPLHGMRMKLRLRK
jgi:cytochrome P450